jgi:hemoglobin-like flavoprotein
MKHGYLISLLLFLSLWGDWACISHKAEVESRQATDKQEATPTAVSTAIVTNNYSVTGLQTEIMSIHDSLMPAMGKMMHLKRQLKIRLEESNIVDESKLKLLRNAVKSLEDADEAMMVWMRSYKTTYENMKETEIKNYLLKEKENINQLKEKMQESIKNAKGLLHK